MKKARIPASSGASNKVMIRYCRLVNFDFKSLLKKIPNWEMTLGILKYF